LTVKLDSKLTKDKRLVFSGKADLPPAAEIYEVQVYGNNSPLLDRAQQTPRPSQQGPVQISFPLRQFGDAGEVSVILALPAKVGKLAKPGDDDIQLRSNLPLKLSKEGEKSLEEFERFLQDFGTSAGGSQRHGLACQTRMPSFRGGQKAIAGEGMRPDSFGLRNAKPLGEQHHAAGAGSD
jgi:hypothetical protein